jgi:hypothetical protein
MLRNCYECTECYERWYATSDWGYLSLEKCGKCGGLLEYVKTVECEGVNDLKKEAVKCTNTNAPSAAGNGTLRQKLRYATSAEVNLNMQRQSIVKMNDAAIRQALKPRLRWNRQKCVPLTAVNNFFFREDGERGLTNGEVVSCVAVTGFFLAALILGP